MLHASIIWPWGQMANYSEVVIYHTANRFTLNCCYEYNHSPLCFNQSLKRWYNHKFIWQRVNGHVCIYEQVFSGCKHGLKSVFLFCTQLWVCALQSVWVVTYIRPPAHSRGGREKSYLHPLKLFLMVSKFHQMASLNRLQSGANHRTIQTEAKPAFTNPKIRPRANFTFHFQESSYPLQIHSQLCKVSMNTELYNYIFQ